MVIRIVPRSMSLLLAGLQHKQRHNNSHLPILGLQLKCSPRYHLKVSRHPSYLGPKYSLNLLQIIGTLKFSQHGPNLKSNHRLILSPPGHTLTSSQICRSHNHLGVNPKNQCSSSNPRLHGHNHHRQTLSLNHHGCNNRSRNPKHNLLGLNRFKLNLSHSSHGFSNHSIRHRNKHGHRRKHHVSLNHLGSQLHLNSSLKLMHGLHHKLKPKFSHLGSKQPHHNFLRSLKPS
ncbi:hypothetical protein F7725_004467 [Dissostichus mawsoni]|uniref:Uncharacterized protein n=1 Tax=Dissostichus mawsoni TaxID=36200 RepID=A0A7J5XJI1_DISMA|nr:hypothetical protein F7725_004467 [Dissostichus mawsoni]